jgi:hypothetical protein
MQPPGNAAREQLRAQLASAYIEPNYSPRRHLLIPSAIGLCGMATMVALLRDLRAVELLTVPLTLLGGFGLEWRVHKDLLHQRVWPFRVLYDRHERLHHVIFTDEDMGLRSRQEMKLVLLPGFVIVAILGLLMPLGLLVGQLVSRSCALLFVATSLMFFLMYEWLHLAYHIPADTRLGRNPLIAKLRSLHQRHHDPALMKRWNFNVTVPLFDWLHGTLWSPARATRAAATARRRFAPGPAEPTADR